jgi:Fur family peroxide stress response transcriptional regulator
VLVARHPGGVVNLQARQRRIEELQRVCRERGLPLTVQRRAVLEAVLERADHPTADQVLQVVQQRLPGVARATVYRTLEALARLGVIAKASLPGHPARYDRLVEAHHHFVCRECETIIDVIDKSIDTLPLPDTSRLGIEVTEFTVQLRGVCHACRAKAASAPRPRRKQLNKAPTNAR